MHSMDARRTYAKVYGLLQDVYQIRGWTASLKESATALAAKRNLRTRGQRPGRPAMAELCNGLVNRNSGMVPQENLLTSRFPLRHPARMKSRSPGLRVRELPRVECFYFPQL